MIGVSEGAKMAFKRINFLIILLLLSIFLFSFFYISSISSYWKITPDSTTYVRGAKSIAEGQGYTEGGRSAPLFPPLSALIYSLGFIISGENYSLLNGIVKLFCLFSFIAIFLYFRRSSGDLRALLITLFTAGSIYLFRWSTFLLSDIFYLFFSFTAFIFVREILNNEKRISRYFLAGITVLIACMTRLIGVAIVLAIIAYLGISLCLKRQKFSPKILIVIILPMLFIVL